MNTSVLVIGLLIAFIGVVWAAMMLWGLICPPVTSHASGRGEPSVPRVSTDKPIVRQQGVERIPVIMVPEGPPIAAVGLPDDEKVVSLSQWRDRHERTG